MATRRMWLRKQVVQFLHDHRGLRDDWKIFTVKNFETKGVFRSTIYNIINNYLRRGNVDHKKGGKRPVNGMTPYKKQRLRQAVNHKTGLSQRHLAGRFNCSHAYISKTLAPGYSNPIKFRKRVKTPYYASYLLKRLAVQNQSVENSTITLQGSLL